ncbi:biotin--[acetyl-CoA-carboxylase] ligase [Hahella sp. KA22]|uniref:biotin--[acetyl-CoA-carboxylase] ligase n=1 Tax=Hahella sp. KA22 TaxID=1628392 RepID=UPI000FDDD38B|nr:biotin--[acetyl-CoA-carboxylase] ligase [Hahella sp. KA22]AZZ94634.1 biotin--[acetyl-CoA-carboxylase] ligase [Hahella sp. KA22]QAY58007.1 biotin--[acetyl-CoA-carboxylase] ligase [Hahella sp. KA22]
MNDKLVEILSDGEFHSGVELGELLGVTRTAVWKHVSQLAAYGLKVETIKGKGYRLECPLCLLDKSRLRDDLKERWKGKLREFNVAHSVGSTNVELLESSRDLPVGLYDVLLAERQTTGKGRRGRVWVSPFAQNIYMSVAVRLSGGFSVLNGLSLAIGAAVADAINTVCDIEVSLKWPNDIWYSERKLAGLLLEVQGEQEGPVHVVIGLGVNVLMQPEAGRDIDQPWTALSDACEVKVDRNQLCVALIDSVLVCLESYKSEGFLGLKGLWDKYDLLKGRKVLVFSGNECWSGEYLGVSNDGYALVRGEDGRLRSLVGGEITVRPVS